MKKLYTLLALVCALNLTAQTTIDFESLNVPVGSFLNGSDGAGGFTFETAFFHNTFEDFGTFTAWSGWSISADTDITTAGFSNQHSSISGSGFDGSNSYATSFVSGGTQIELLNKASGHEVEGCYINNATYPFLSMRDGDGFAKKFGGETGNDPDFFLLTIKKYLNGELSQDSISFYLADYRFDDNSLDYIVDEWTYVNLKPLGAVDSLLFTLSSSDVGVYGMNTPGYFCLDNFTTLDDPSNTDDFNVFTNHNIYPSPTSDFINFELENEGKAELLIYNLNGQKIIHREVTNRKNSIDVSNLNIGQYRVLIKQNDNVYTSSFIKI